MFVKKQRVQRDPETNEFENCWPSPCLSLKSHTPVLFSEYTSYADISFYFSNTPREFLLQCLRPRSGFHQVITWLTPYHSDVSTNIIFSERASLTKVAPLSLPVHSMMLFSSLQLLPSHQSGKWLMPTFGKNKGLFYFVTTSASPSACNTKSKVAHPKSLAELE